MGELRVTLELTQEEMEMLLDAYRVALYAARGLESRLREDIGNLSEALDGVRASRDGLARAVEELHQERKEWREQDIASRDDWSAEIRHANEKAKQAAAERDALRQQLAASEQAIRGGGEQQ